MGRKMWSYVWDLHHRPSQDSHMGERNESDPAMIEERLVEMHPLHQLGSSCWNTRMGRARSIALGPAKRQKREWNQRTNLD